MNTLSIIWNIDKVFFSIEGIEIIYYGLCWLIGILASIYLAKYIYYKEKISIKLLDSLIIYIIVGTIIGARLGHCLLYDPSYYLSHPIEMLLPISLNSTGNYTFTGYTGLASHGGGLEIIIATIIYSRKKKVSAWDTLDKLAVLTPLAGAFIQIGNFFNSEIVGTPTSMPWGVTFLSVDNTPRHPAQLYEAIAYLLILAISYTIYMNKKRKQQPGFVFGFIVVLIFVFRFLIEFCKERQVSFESYLPIDIGQILSIPFVIYGIIIVIAKYSKKEEIRNN